MVEGNGKQPKAPGMTYRDAGVDIDAQDRALALIKGHLRATRTPGVLCPRAPDVFMPSVFSA